MRLPSPNSNSRVLTHRSPLDYDSRESLRQGACACSCGERGSLKSSDGSGGGVLFEIGAVPQLEEPRRGGGARVWVSQWFEVRRKRRTGRGRTPSRAAWGSPNPGTQVCGAGTHSPGAEAAAYLDGGEMEQRERGGGIPRLPGELGAKWSLLGMRPSWFPSPTLPSLSGGCQGYPLPPSGEMGKGLARSCQSRAGEGSL